MFDQVFASARDKSKPPENLINTSLLCQTDTISKSEARNEHGFHSVITGACTSRPWATYQWSEFLDSLDLVVGALKNLQLFELSQISELSTNQFVIVDFQL